MENNIKPSDLELLKMLIQKHSGYLYKEIQLNSSLNKSSYGMTHNEAGLFFDEIHQKFEIKFPSDFDVRKYFIVEGFEIPNFLKRFFGINYIPKISDKNINVKHILDVIEKKEWFEPS